MSHCCKEIYWACYQHRKSQSLGANGRCFAYCGIFSYRALSRLMQRRQAAHSAPLLLFQQAPREPCHLQLSACKGRGCSEPPEHPCSLKKCFVFKCWCPPAQQSPWNA